MAMAQNLEGRSHPPQRHCKYPVGTRCLVGVHQSPKEGLGPMVKLVGNGGVAIAVWLLLLRSQKTNIPMQTQQTGLMSVGQAWQRADDHATRALISWSQRPIQ